MSEYRSWQDRGQFEFLGRTVQYLDLTRELGPDIPVYPGHARTAFWWHMTHEECVMRLGDTPFEGYGSMGIATSDHVATHVDAIYHFNKHRPDLTAEKIPVEVMITPAAWIDLAHAPKPGHITLDMVKRALEKAEVTLKPGMTLLYYTGISEYYHDAKTFVSKYPGLDHEASEWLLNQGIANLVTDALSTDTPIDVTYPNHTLHGQRLVHHTENAANINRIPRHQGFYFGMFPLRLVGATGSPVRALAMWEE